MTTAAGLLAGGGAHAQGIVVGQSVADRAHPEYDPVSIPLGGFELLPAVNFGFDATDNYRASNINRQADATVSIRPEARLRSRWSRHQLSADAYFDQRIHFNLGQENASTYGGAIRGLYDISRQTQLTGELVGQSNVESRTALGSFRGSTEPVRYEFFRAGLGASQAFNALTVSARGSAETYDYHDAKSAIGTIDQDFRDYRRLALGGDARYAFDTGLGLIGSLQYDRTSYDFGRGSGGFVAGRDLDRDSSGISAQAGVSLELTRLIFGTIQAGYLTRRYRDPRLRDFNGLTFSANVLWNPTALTSVRLRASRSVEESASTTFAGNTRSDISVRVDHELFRYVLVSGDLSYDRFRANGPGARGDEYSASLGARYLIDRRFTLTGSLRHNRRTSNAAGLRYNATNATVGVRVAF